MPADIEAVPVDGVRHFDDALVRDDEEAVHAGSENPGDELLDLADEFGNGVGAGGPEFCFDFHNQLFAFIEDQAGFEFCHKMLL